ncbi:hypothetical protein CEXT_798511 [Caerostris extrusa]|uniref:Uncharacterized protein n=1 Tax=Caerostris extrusa TaxID=172846 RepID=A0AAV4Q4A8_CAEEX|nr:hypothetical protein CEXT_798511 [Caerostris extrusa]
MVMTSDVLSRLIHMRKQCEVAADDVLKDFCMWNRTVGSEVFLVMERVVKLLYSTFEKNAWSFQEKGLFDSLKVETYLLCAKLENYSWIDIE